jgi:hypothetical protein
LRQDNPELDIQVRPIVLTHEQCVAYELPRTPIKDTERRAAKFEERFGEGATELDALEALHPGQLQRIVETEVARYYDATLDERWRVAKSAVETELYRIRQEVWDNHDDAATLFSTRAVRPAEPGFSRLLIVLLGGVRRLML